MNYAKRIFIIVTGEEGSYPSKRNATLKITDHDPVNLNYTEHFLSSPIFSLLEDGNLLSQTDTRIRISYFIVPKIYPTLNELPLSVEESHSVWFSLGLANIIVIEKEEQEVSYKLKNFFTRSKQLCRS